MPKKKILIVEDEKNIAKLVSYNLEKEAFECATATSGEEALKMLEKGSFVLVILDLMLPGMDGLELCRRMKSDDRLKRVSVVMLTAKGEEVDRIVGFELGATDYVVKPFSPRELVLRVKSILKRTEGKERDGDIFRIGEIEVDLPSHKISVRGKALELTLMEFNLLVTLMKRAGRVQTRERLLNDVWGIEAYVTTRTVDTHIKRLREKLGKASSRIETVRGVGYKFLK